MVHRSGHRLASHMRSVEKSVQVVKQLVSSAQSIDHGFSYFGMAILRPIARVLVMFALVVVRSAERVVSTKLEPSTTQVRRGCAVKATDVRSHLWDKTHLMNTRSHRKQIKLSYKVDSKQVKLHNTDDRVAQLFPIGIIVTESVGCISP